MNILDQYNDILGRIIKKTNNTDDAKDIVQQSYLDFYEYKGIWETPEKAIQMLATRNLYSYYKKKYLWRDIVLSIEDISKTISDSEDNDVDFIGTNFSYNLGEYNVDKAYFQAVLKKADADAVKAYHGLLNRPYNKLTVRTMSCYLVNKEGKKNEYCTLTKIRSRSLSVKA